MNGKVCELYHHKVVIKEKKKKENMLWDHMRKKKITVEQLNVRDEQLWILFIRAAEEAVSGCEGREKSRGLNLIIPQFKDCGRKGMVRERVFSYRAFINGIEFTCIILIRKTHSMEFGHLAISTGHAIKLANGG